MITIHKSAYYAAYLHDKAGLIIQSTRKQGGIRIEPEHPQYENWLYAIRTSLDNIEADALCKALLN